MANKIRDIIISSNPDTAYTAALKFARTHYENFPVVSFLVPASLRKHIAIIYWFARTADDFADEGNLSYAERLKNLNNFEYRFFELLKKNFTNEYEFALYSTINEKCLTPKLFLNLLEAFKQDVTKTRYETFNELIEYCKNSANPVGRLILELNNIKDEKAFYYSDKICTALQLTNFWQDTRADFEKGRIYYPREDMKKFKVDEKIFELKENNLNFKALLKFNVERTNRLFEEGEKLFSFLNGRLKYEIKWTTLGGQEILKKINKLDYNVMQTRPKLNLSNFLILLLRSIF